jgi:hypothetical protein
MVYWYNGTLLHWYNGTMVHWWDSKKSVKQVVAYNRTCTTIRIKDCNTIW